MLQPGDKLTTIQKILWVAITGTFAAIGLIIGILLGDWWTEQPWVKQSIQSLRTDFGRYAAIAAMTGLVVFCMTYVGMWLARSAGKLERISTADKAAVVAGIVMGMVIAALLASFAFPTVWFEHRWLLAWVARILLLIMCCALCLTITLGMKDEIARTFPRISAFNELGGLGSLELDAPRSKLLDTNIIIDGRMAEIVKSGFIEGPLYIPSFVLNELQQIADSADSLRRARGRRGLDVLEQMRQQGRVSVRVYDQYDRTIDRLVTVDEKLVALAKSIKATIITNDFNLNKVAALHGVTVLNVNELANALKPVVLPGEELTVEIIKEGKEENQGVGYLADGTMVVVENGKRHIGETLQVAITSVYQTVAGKMIFGETKMGSHRTDKDDLFSESDSVGTGGRSRRTRRS